MNEDRIAELEADIQLLDQDRFTDDDRRMLKEVHECLMMIRPLLENPAALLEGLPPQLKMILGM